VGFGYYPFGMAMPGRQFSSDKYRYGYQGSEKDKELNTNTYTTFFREIDTRIGRWWSIDPKTNFSESPYVIMNNSPIQYNDILGDSIGPNKTKGYNQTMLEKTIKPIELTIKK
jgi:RHS repeat-associated protein